jgi:uncharacterized membrane protein YcaP (DUF421 family)
LLISAQFVVAFTSVRWKPFAAAVRSEPALLARDGRFCEAAMRRERITQDEALSAVRANGGRRIEEVESLILESDGTLSVKLTS